MKKEYGYIADFMLLAILLFSCGASSLVTGSDFKIIDSIKNYFEQKVNKMYVENFKISGHGNYKIIKTNARFNAGQGGGNEAKEDIMVPVHKWSPIPSLNGEAQIMMDIGVIKQRDHELYLKGHFEKSIKSLFKVNDNLYSIMRFNHEKYSVNTRDPT
ncbi:MAG: hypothetical protein AAF620_03550 [Bacteroidota bacterium]